MKNKRQELILQYLNQTKEASRQDIEDFLQKNGILGSKITILRDLDDLAQECLIEKSGKAKATIYKLSSQSSLLLPIDVEAYFDIPQDNRKIASIRFNFEIFNKLKGLLTTIEKDELQSLNDTYRQKRQSLSPTLLQKEFERLTVELAWKSSKIEGNTYTLLDTERLLKENVSATGKTAEETQMILNHKKALDFVLQAPEYYKELSVAKVEDIHRLLTEGLNVSQGIRNARVGIIGTDYTPLDNQYQIREALNDLITLINKTPNPIEKALIAVLMIAYIQPFEDGNKRTSRILGNALLLANDYCPLSYRSVDEIDYKKGVILFYEQNNIAYFKQLFIDQFKQAVQKYF